MQNLQYSERSKFDVHLLYLSLHLWWVTETHELMGVVCRYILSKWSKVAEAVIVSVMSAVLGFLLIVCVHDCKADPQGDDVHHHPGGVQVSTPSDIRLQLVRSSVEEDMNDRCPMMVMVMRTSECVEPLVLQLNCPEGQHNVMSRIFFKTPEASLIGMLHDSEGLAMHAYRQIVLAFYIFATQAHRFCRNLLGNVHHLWAMHIQRMFVKAKSALHSRSW